MKKLILFISLVISIAVSAQTYNGNITLLTQQDVDDFAIDYPGINSVNGSLIVGDFNNTTNINDLSPLQSIVSISNQLYIVNTSLTQISGFTNLTNCYSLVIHNNSQLQSINAFSNISNINYLSIFNAPLLTSINGFNNFQNLNNLGINNCQNLTTINAFNALLNVSNYLDISSVKISNTNFLSSLSNAGVLTLGMNYSLSDITGLSNLITVNEIHLIHSPVTSLSAFSNIHNLNVLDLIGVKTPNLSGLNNLTQVTGNLTIRFNNYFQNFSLNGLSSIANIGNLNISNNNTLVDLSALNHPITITGNLTITNNTILSNCAAQAICNYLGVNAANATISGNATGCNSTSEVIAACNPVPITKIRTQDCGLQTTSFGHVFYADPVVGASTYEFHFTEVGTGAVITHTRTTYSEALYLAGVLGINKTYDVKVRVKVNGVWGNYGTSCQIKSPINPLTQIRTQDCGLQTTSFGHVFYADAMAGASAYEFEFTETLTGNVINHVRSTYSEALYLAGVLGINKTYDVKVRAQFGGVWANYGASCQIKSPINPITQIRSQDCGLQTASFAHAFYADYMAGASAYEFEFTETLTGNVINHVRSTYSEALYLAGVLGINKTYDVKVRAQFGGVWANYGASCQIKSPINPITQIRSQDCGLQTTSFAHAFYADYMAGASAYEFEFTETLTGNVINHVRSTYSEALYLAGVLGINKTYDVKVRAQFGGVWANYGASCQIKSPINPVTQIRAQDCGLQTTSLTQAFYSDYMAGASAYEFEFTETLTGITTNHVRSIYSEALYLVPLNSVNKTYDVRVRAQFGGVWANYGAICQIKSPLSAQRLAGNSLANEESIDENINIKMYPNPTTNVLNITELTESSTINVFNVSGQLVLTKSSIDTNEKIDLSALDNGIYMIVIEGKNGETAKRQRVVLAK